MTTAELLSRYGDERVPRYTSYPTAPHFTDAVSTEVYAGWLAQAPADAALSLYLHVPFCRAMCWYCGCNTAVTQRDEPIADYLEALRREIEEVAERLGAPRRVSHVHFGGGTPTIMAPTQFLDLMRLLRRRFVIASAEIAVEIDPRTATPEMIAALGEAGVNRASLGVQSFDPAVQAAINRRQSIAQTRWAIERLRAVGVGGVNVDLIYGLPRQTVESCRQTAREAIGLRPDRFSVFGYAHVPAFKKHQRKIVEADLPDGSERQAQTEAIAETLEDAGYRRIGLDHYAAPDDLMSQAQSAGALRRNFQGYTTDPCDALIGFGASAISRLPQGYAQNESIVGSYAKRIGRGELATAKGRSLTADDRLRAHIIERIMCDFAVDLTGICEAHGVDVAALIAAAPRLRALVEDGIVRLDGAALTVAEHARLLVRHVAAAFDAYWGASERLHSRAV